MKILIVEDEPKTVSLLKRGFTEVGFNVEVSDNGIDGLHSAETGEYDLIILDIMLPGRDGWSVLEALKHKGIKCPVILLTALDAVSQRVRGLTSGADDYLVKPFSFSELLARTHNLIRRAPPRQQELLRYHDLELDMVRHKVVRAGIDDLIREREGLIIQLACSKTYQQ